MVNVQKIVLTTKILPLDMIDKSYQNAVPSFLDLNYI